MKKILTLSVCLFASTLQAATAIDGWYGSVFGGYTYFPDNVSTWVNNARFTYAKFDDGWHAGARFGYQSNPMRYELEYTYTQGNAYHAQLGNVQLPQVTGQTNASFGMANVYYDFPDFVPSIGPFLGMGIGYANVRTKINSFTNVPAIRFNQSNTVFAYQGTVGATYNFAENYALNLAYRYAATDRASQLGKRYQAHFATVGFVYRFNENMYK